MSTKPAPDCFTRIDRALTQALAAYNTGWPDDVAEMPQPTGLDGHFGPGLEDFLRRHAAEFNDDVYFMAHDEPQCGLDGEWPRLLQGDGFSIDKFSVSPGVHVLACWTNGGYIDNAALFLFGLRLPELTYSMGGPVVYSLGV
jgi:hypothetical protein